MVMEMMVHDGDLPRLDKICNLQMIFPASLHNGRHQVPLLDYRNAVETNINLHKFAYVFSGKCHECVHASCIQSAPMESNQMEQF